MKIKIDESVYSKVPKEIKDLDHEWYRLTKTGSKFKTPTVDIRQFEDGEISILAFNGKPRFYIINTESLVTSGIMTSPILGVTNKTQDFLEFETEGGLYKLERIYK